MKRQVRLSLSLSPNHRSSTQGRGSSRSKLMRASASRGVSEKSSETNSDISREQSVDPTPKLTREQLEAMSQAQEETAGRPRVWGPEVKPRLGINREEEEYTECAQRPGIRTTTGQ